MSNFKKLDKRVRKLDLHDIQLTKLSVFTFALFLLTVWPGAADLLLSVHWGIYLVVFVLAVIRPIKNFYS